MPGGTWAYIRSEGGAQRVKFAPVLIHELKNRPRCGLLCGELVNSLLLEVADRRGEIDLLVAFRIRGQASRQIEGDISETERRSYFGDKAREPQEKVDQWRHQALGRRRRRRLQLRFDVVVGAELR